MMPINPGIRNHMHSISFINFNYIGLSAFIYFSYGQIIEGLVPTRFPNEARKMTIRKFGSLVIGSWS